MVAANVSADVFDLVDGEVQDEADVIGAVGGVREEADELAFTGDDGGSGQTVGRHTLVEDEGRVQARSRRTRAARTPPCLHALHRRHSQEVDLVQLAYLSALRRRKLRKAIGFDVFDRTDEVDHGVVMFLVPIAVACPSERPRNVDPASIVRSVSSKLNLSTEKIKWRVNYRALWKS